MEIASLLCTTQQKRAAIFRCKARRILLCGRVTRSSCVFDYRAKVCLLLFLFCFVYFMPKTNSNFFFIRVSLPNFSLLLFGFLRPELTSICSSHQISTHSKAALKRSEFAETRICPRPMQLASKTATLHVVAKVAHNSTLHNKRKNETDTKTANTQIRRKQITKSKLATQTHLNAKFEASSRLQIVLQLFLSPLNLNAAFLH